MLITFNYKDGTQTVRFEDTLTADGVEGKSSDLFSLAGPKIQRFHVRNRWIFLLIGWPHLALTTILTTMPKILSGPISAVPSNFQAENASLNNWTALCRMDS